VTDCFTCATPQNYAAVALKMQETALAAESCIFELEQRLRGAVNQPALIVPATFGAFPDNSLVILSLGTATFQNSQFTSFFTPLPRGVYEVGLSFTMTATGAVSDNTYRFARISTRNAYLPLSAPDKSTVYEIVFESNNGAGMDMTLHTVVTSDGNDVVRFLAQHGNTASTCTVTNGLAWAVRLSDLDAPRVVI